MPQRLKLFIPGPTEVRPEVLEAMSRPPISHRGPEIATLQRSITDQAARIMFTASPVLLGTCTATGFMEAGILNGVRRRVLSLVCGAFSRRWHRIALDCGKEADALEVPWGRAIRPEAVGEALATGKYDAVTMVHNETSTGVANPLEAIAGVMSKYPDVVFMVDTVSSLGGMPVKVDTLGIDLCLASVQKALALPPGFSICSVSSRLMERSRAARGKGFYFDFVRMLDKAEQGQPLTTPSISHMYAMDKQFARILDEGIERRWERHRRMAETTRAWAKERFALFAEEEHASDTLTCLSNTRGISVANLIAHLRQNGILIGNGYGDLKEKAFRIAHMGEIMPEEIESLLSMIDRFLEKPV
jgi:aspartate aminotransferase-like enzyme